MSRPRETTKIYVKHVTGYFRRLRIISGAVLFLFFFSGVWLKIDGEPLILFDLPERKFYLFGTVFWPQDIILLSLVLAISAFGLFAITTLFGRIWCGYACPQSVFSWLFLWAERVTEGSRYRRIKQDQQAMIFPLFIKKLAKHGIWLLISIATAITFVGYFVPIEILLSQLLIFHLLQWSYFWTGFFTVATYINAGWLREKVCLHACPYARFQSVMLDNQTLIVAYDKKRGEPRRNPINSSQMPFSQQKTGDCINCSLCVQVCPTGIDIRKGLQYECLSCGACIDACNNVMKKLHRPENLIHYEKQDTEHHKAAQWLRPKIIGYGCVLLIMVSILASMLLTRQTMHISLTHDPAVLYRIEDDGRISNSYQLKIINKNQFSVTAHISVSDSQTFALGSPFFFTLEGGEVLEQVITLTASSPQLLQAVTPIRFIIQTKTQNIDPIEKESRFLSPTR